MQKFKIFCYICFIFIDMCVCVKVYICMYFWLISHLKINYTYDTNSSACIIRKQDHSLIHSLRNLAVISQKLNSHLHFPNCLANIF